MKPKEPRNADERTDAQTMRRKSTYSTQTGAEGMKPKEPQRGRDHVRARRLRADSDGLFLACLDPPPLLQHIDIPVARAANTPSASCSHTTRHVVNHTRSCTPPHARAHSFVTHTYTHTDTTPPAAPTDSYTSNSPSIRETSSTTSHDK